MSIIKSTNNNALHETEKAYTFVGVAIGSTFPVFGVLSEMWAKSLQGLETDIISIFSSNIPLSLALLCPFLMGRVFLEIGKRQRLLEEKLGQINQTEKALRYQAHHDALTGLFNRASLAGLMEEGIATGQWQINGAMIYLLDLDNFKHINDTYGHHAGDEVLKEVAARLQAVANEDDIVVRLGGDEFLIVHFPEEARISHTPFSQKIISAITPEIEFQKAKVFPKASIGIARVGKDGNNWSDLLRSADIALYGAKSDPGKSSYVYSRKMKRHSEKETQLEKDMRSGLEAGEFELYYQPIYGTKTGTLRSFEALIRWNHPTKGLISPLDFIPVAERSGFIIPLGECILLEACKAAARWPKPVGVSVNLSPVQFKEPHLLSYVQQALEQSGLAPGRLDVEITENILLEPSPHVVEKIDAIRALGVRITMDDFGTGFSSLNNLRNFHFDRLKIDRSFTKGVPEIREDGEIIKTILKLSKILKMDTVIEGVETLEQLEFAVEEGATEVQGYLYSEPVPLSEVDEFLVINNALTESKRSKVA